MERHYLNPKSLHARRDSKMLDLHSKVVAALLLSGNTFPTLNHHKQGVGKIYKLQQAMGLLPQLTEKPKKSDEEARKLRTRGNDAYRAKDATEALLLYSKAICCAELEGQEIAMAYANRSAVTFGLQEYQNSIDDINRALSTNKYPINLTHKLFERRGKCFLALSQFRRASEDFRQVIILLLHSELDTNKVTSLKAYLDLLAECRGKEDIPKTSTAHQPKLTHGPSPNIQSASAAVEIKFSTEMGRHIVATTDIAPGDILAVEKPFASVLFYDCHHLFCNNCMRRCHSSVPCPSCNNVVYCSELCREVGWTTHHSVECDILHDLINLGCLPTDMLAIRMLLISTKLGENLHMFMDDSVDGPGAASKPEKAGFVNNMYMSDHYIPVHHLLTHMERHNSQDILLVAVAACSLVHVLKEATTFFDKSDSFIPSTALFKPVSDLGWNHSVAADLLMRYILVLSCNGHITQEISYRLEEDEKRVKEEITGSAIYPFCSLVNHSCDPDVTTCFFDGNTKIMIATKPMKKGQQIFATYRFHYADDHLLARQIGLSSHFYFTCKCPACLEDWPTFLGLPESPKFVSKRAERNHGAEIGLFCTTYLPKILMAMEKGRMTEEQFQCLKRNLSLIHKCVKRPWKICQLCEKALSSYFALYFNTADTL